MLMLPGSKTIIRNFLFHRVSDDIDTLWPPMKPRLFERIIKKLSANYQVVSLEAYLGDTKTFSKVSKPIATILFDDGYKDNIEYAAPILDKYRCPASFYIVTDCIDRNVPTWTYIVDHILQNTRQPYIELDFGYVPERFKKVTLTDKINNHGQKLKPWMKSLPNQLRLEIQQAITVQCHDIVLPRNQMLNWDEVRELCNGGFAVGSHTHTHPMLGQLENLHEIERELETSFVKIKDQLGFVPETVSYPIGSYDKRVMKLSKQTGYKWGLAVEQKFYKVATDDLFAIPRVELYQQPWYKVNARITGAYTAIKSLWT